MAPRKARGQPSCGERGPSGESTRRDAFEIAFSSRPSQNCGPRRRRHTDGVSRATRTAFTSATGVYHGNRNHPQWFAALRERAGRLIYRHDSHRSAVSSQGIRPRRRRERHLRTRCPHRLAHSSAGSDADCHVRTRVGAARRWTRAGGSSRRCGLVSARAEALARRHANDGDVAHCDSRAARRQSRRLDGKGQRGTISAMKNRDLPNCAK